MSTTSTQYLHSNTQISVDYTTGDYRLVDAQDEASHISRGIEVKEL